MKLMRVIDGQAVERRRKRRLLRHRYICPGPNDVWHIDGYDKLKPFGFAIHGAIDGFSRRILWLEVGRSNNNPDIILMCTCSGRFRGKILLLPPHTESRRFSETRKNYATTPPPTESRRLSETRKNYATTPPPH